eukprot:450384-Rhodomonas_salina.1
MQPLLVPLRKKKEWITWTVSSESQTYSRKRPAQLDRPRFHVDKSTTWLHSSYLRSSAKKQLKP